MAVERIGSSLQENLLTILAYSDQEGKLVCNLVNPDLFDGEMKTIAQRCIEYWRQEGEAPKHHTADLVAEIIDDPKNRRGPAIKRILRGMVELSDSINTRYVIDQLRTFTRMQLLKDAIVKSAEQLNKEQEMAVEEIEEIWAKLLKVKDTGFDPGIRLTETQRVLTALEMRQSEFKLGIPELDKRFVVPYRDSVMLLLGATGRGKSWFLTHVGKMALIQRKKVVHISGEMIEEQVAARYYQALFAVTKRDAEVEVPVLTIRKGELIGLAKQKVKPEFTFDSRSVQDELEQRLIDRGSKFDNIRIKRLAPLTIKAIEAYLDNLEITENFIPDLVILDYIGLTKTSSKEKRVDLGQNFIDFRNIILDRHMAGVTAQQSSKLGMQSKTVGITNVAEDWSLTNTADTVLTLSATDEEKRRGFARLYVPKARDESDTFGVLITQSYPMGQFVLNSTYLKPEYFKMVEHGFDGYDDEAEEDGDED